MLEYSNWEVNALVLLVTSILSFIGSCMLVLCCIRYSKGHGISRIVYYLGIADIGWSCVGVVTFSLAVGNPDVVGLNFCVWSRVLYQFFGSASVIWSASISVFLYRKFTVTKKPQDTNHSFSAKMKRHKSMIIYHCCSWGIPLLQCLSTFPFIEKITDQPICLPRQPFLGLLWFLPIAIAIVICIVVHICFIRAIRNPYFGRINHTSRVPLRVSLYIVVMCLCWIPDIVYYCVEFISDHHSAIAIVVNGLLELQGLLDCIVYGMVNKEFRSHFSGVRGFARAIFSPILVPCAIAQSIYYTIKILVLKQPEDPSRYHLVEHPNYSSMVYS